MPAVTVENPLTLPRVAASTEAVARPVLAVTHRAERIRG